LAQRRELVDGQTAIQDRLDEIANLLTRFDLLLAHYAVDVERLTAIKKAGRCFLTLNWLLALFAVHYRKHSTMMLLAMGTLMQSSGFFSRS